MDPITLALLVGGTASGAAGSLVAGFANENEAQRQANLARARGQINANMTAANTQLADNTTAGLDRLTGQRFQADQGILASLPAASAAGGAAEEAATQRAIADHVAGIAPTSGWGAGVTSNAAPHLALQNARASLLARQRGSGRGAANVQQQLDEADAGIGRQAGDLRARSDLLSRYVDMYGAKEGARFADKGPKAGYWDRQLFGTISKSLGKTATSAAGAMA